MFRPEADYDIGNLLSTSTCSATLTPFWPNSLERGGENISYVLFSDLSGIYCREQLNLMGDVD